MEDQYKRAFEYRLTDTEVSQIIRRSVPATMEYDTGTIVYGEPDMELGEPNESYLWEEDDDA